MFPRGSRPKTVGSSILKLRSLAVFLTSLSLPLSFLTSAVPIPKLSFVELLQVQMAFEELQALPLLLALTLRCLNKVR